MDLISVGAIGLRSQLIAVPELTVLIPSSAGSKIFLESAEGQADPPYVLTHHIFGGDENAAPSQSFDMLWRVDGVASSQSGARELAGLAYDNIHRHRLTYPDGWVSWSDATATGNYLEQVTIQAVQYWAIGFFVRLRGSKPA